MPGAGSFSRVAIVGASSLRGKELKQVLEDRNFPATEVVLFDESVMAGTLTEAAGEPTFIRALEEDSFEGVRFAFFAGSALDAEQNWLAAQRAGATVIDLTGSGCRVRSGDDMDSVAGIVDSAAPWRESERRLSAHGVLFSAVAGDHRVDSCRRLWQIPAATYCHSAFSAGFRTRSGGHRGTRKPDDEAAFVSPDRASGV